MNDDFLDIKVAPHHEASTAVKNSVEVMHRVLIDIGWAEPCSKLTRRVEVDFESSQSPVSTVELAIDEVAECLILCINFAYEATPNVRQQVLRFITRANWALVVGNFEMDVNSGELRFRSSLVFGSTALSETLVQRLIASAMDVVDRHVAELMLVLKGGFDADVAIESVWLKNTTEVK
jgi:hypothetical protein